MITFGQHLNFISLLYDSVFKNVTVICSVFGHLCVIKTSLRSWSIISLITYSPTINYPCFSTLQNFNTLDCTWDMTISIKFTISYIYILNVRDLSIKIITFYLIFREKKISVWTVMKVVTLSKVYGLYI